MPSFFKAYSIVYIVLYAILFVMGLLYAIAPRWTWKTLESWRATKEPTKAFFVVRRICGIFIMIVVVAMATAPAWIAYFDK